MKITCLLNWQAAPYHAPLYLAQKMGFFEKNGIKVAILEPADPSDVTEVIGTGKSDLGLKAMIHTIAGKAAGFNVTSIGTLLDEPLTGIVHVKSQSGITDFDSLRGKRIGYVGHFGKVIIDELMRSRGFKETDYTAVRVGMRVTESIKAGIIDAGVGLENVQQAELENWVVSRGGDKSDVEMLRIDELADLGCCCFCSILYIGNDKFLEENPEKVKAFMASVREATDYMLANPDAAYQKFIEMKPTLNTADQRSIYDRSMPYFSKDLLNVQRDWNKVTGYCKRLELIKDDFVQNQTNEFIAQQQ
ncbi:NMT1/THI5 like-domain-containing protein [Globomyces pollinis-pini]|nr:NMT1/THI5 like-domain-containing protein [Globomyces pollinis-pini]